jgi:hypothetical protein
MRRRRNRRYLKKRLRLREKQLGNAVSLFVDKFEPRQSLEDEPNFRLLLKLRWLVNDFIYLRLKLHPLWMKKQWFLDLLDVDNVTVRNGSVILAGDAVWWAQGRDADGEWWPADHEPRKSGPYKIKLRGDLSGGRWVLEPVRAELKLPANEKRVAGYRVEFGQDSTYMVIEGGR